jgi:signal transduction histidine kinase
MKLDLSEVAFVIVAGTLLFFILISFLISFFVIYQKRKSRIEDERRLEREQFQREINNAELEIREETLKFISQELHDNIAQMLAVTSIALQRLDLSSPIFIETEKSLNQTIKQVRLLSKTLNTDGLLEEGFLKSLDFEVNRLKQLDRWNIDYFNDLSSVNISNDKQLLLFRIFQELLNNLIKYAQASNVVIVF